MDKRKMRIFFLTGIMACLSFLISVAQPVLKTSANKDEILIGDQFKLKIEASSIPEGYKINWPVLSDSLPHFEVINRSKVDSLYTESKLTGLVQTFTLTSFDSGKWILPSFLVSMVPEKEQDSTFSFFTDSVPVTVSFSTADSTNTLKDIKPILEADTASQLWYWVGAGVLLLALVTFLVWFYKFYKKNKTSPAPSRSKSSPYEEAMKELENLNTYNLTVPEEIRLVHIKLGDILKRYLSRTQKNNYLNKTTADILIFMRAHFLDKNMAVKAAAFLRCGDAVKFAKYLPPAAESEECLRSVKGLINDIHQQNNNIQTNPAVTNQPKT